MKLLKQQTVVATDNNLNITVKVITHIIAILMSSKDILSFRTAVIRGEKALKIDLFVSLKAA